MSLVERNIRSRIEALLGEESIVFLQGPRACGKSTLLSELARARSRDVLDLSDPAERTVASQDPSSYLADRPEPVFIDEFQTVASLLPVLKRSVDRSPRSGAFMLTGSTTQDLLPKGSESLAGRSVVTTMWGFSQGEIRGSVERFVDTLFDQPEALRANHSRVGRAEYAAAVATGGFPEVVRRTRIDARKRWHTEYTARVADRDLADLVRLRQPGLLRSVLALSAARTADVLNVSTMASELAAGREAVRTYIELLERVFLLRRLRPYATNISARVTRHAKLHVCDSGIATTLARLDQNTVGRHPHFGHLLESFVVSELTKQLGWSTTMCDPWFFRDADGNEVDLVLERDDGSLVGIEVKAGVEAGPADARGLRRLRSLVGDRFVHGVVLYTGERSFRIDSDPKITAHPVATLWEV